MLLLVHCTYLLGQLYGNIYALMKSIYMDMKQLHCIHRHFERVYL